MLQAASVLAALAAAPVSGNMNGKYSVASIDKQDVPFNDDYASKGHEYFDVWSPEIATTYGENYWTSMGVHALPDDIVKRFEGKVIAITGYEQDQVMVDPVGQPAVHPERDVSVPINWAYNHHYMAWMVGPNSQMMEVVAEPGDTSAHGAPTKWVAQDLPAASVRAFPNAPTSLMFSEGNGGESRKSFHGYPNGFAQLLESPQAWHLTPMQIDTRRRDCGVTRDDVDKCVQFEPWMEPKQARYGRNVSQANYSGILECPCNERYGGDPIFYPKAETKIVKTEYDALPQGGACDASQRVANASSCWDAAINLGLDASRMYNVSLSNASVPPGCTLQRMPAGRVAVTFNTATPTTSVSTAACPAGGVRSGQATSTVNVTLNITLDPRPAGGLATITVRGPSAGWFGVGLNAMAMADAPYAIISNASGAFEQQIGTCGSEAEHCEGDRLATQSLTVVSNTVEDGFRTLVLTRAFAGATSRHFTFDPTTLSTLNFITAIGQSQVFAYHKAHHAASLVMLAPVGSPTCLCNFGTLGMLCTTSGGQCHKFTKNCWPAWDGNTSHNGGDLLAQRNPTCNARQYSGGLTCCGHRRVLLDVDQDPGPTLLRYHLKFRFWFQEWKQGPLPTPGQYTLRPGALPNGFDALPSTTMRVDDALALCTATANCTGITFGATTSKAAGDPVVVYFKTSFVSLANGDPNWQSWVLSTRPSHEHLTRFYYQTEADAGEYDIPPAFRRKGDPPIPGYPEIGISTGPKDLHLTPGTSCTGTCPGGPACECVHTITRHWLMSNARMLYAGGHCHAPSCIGIELYQNATGTPQLVCWQATKYGKGDVKADKYDEAGYVVLPPCLWSDDAAEGLEPPIWLPPNTPMISVKRNRNTWAGHYGDMASWQMRGVMFPAEHQQLA